MSRFETLPRDEGVSDGLAARVHDPLWLLARQWQFGEFRGEDAGSIAIADVEADTHRLDGWRPAGEPAFRPYDPAGEPLERLVEEETRDPASDPRLRVEGGMRLARLLAKAGIDGAPFLARYGFAANPQPNPQAPVPRGLDAVLRRRAADGRAIANGMRLLAEPASFAAEADALGLAGADRAAAPGSRRSGWPGGTLGRRLPRSPSCTRRRGTSIASSTRSRPEPHRSPTPS